MVFIFSRHVLPMQYNSEKLDIKVFIRGNGILFKAIKISLGLLINTRSNSGKSPPLGINNYK